MRVPLLKNIKFRSEEKNRGKGRKEKGYEDMSKWNILDYSTTEECKAGRFMKDFQ